MRREFTIKVDGVDYPVVAEGDSIEVNGRSFVVEVADDGTVLVDGIAYDVTLAGETATVDSTSHVVKVDGLIVASAPASPAAATTTPPPDVGSDDGAVRAVMPGKIVRVLVEPGQRIEEGTAVCVLEAMKMENELRAHSDCVVKAVHVKPGDDVQEGRVLVEVEDL